MTTYSLWLDDLDIALLPVRSQTNDFLKKEYYQFQLLENDKDEEPPASINYTCHICAIDVPAAYSEEHAAGKKHIANTRILAAASKRMRGLIAARLPSRAPRPAGRFCDACAAIAEKDHETTPQHKLAVREDKLLCLLSTYYSDDINLADEEEVSKMNQEEKKTHTNTNGGIVSDAAKPNTAKAYVAYQTQLVSSEEKIENEQLNKAENVIDKVKVSSVEGNKDKLYNEKHIYNAAKPYSVDDPTQLLRAGEKIRNNNENEDGVHLIGDNKISKVDKNLEGKNNHNGKEDCKNKQLKVDANKSVDDVKGSQIHERVEVKDKKSCKNDNKDVNTVKTSDNANGNKIDHEESRVVEKIRNVQHNGDENATDPNDPHRFFFWALVKRYKLSLNAQTKIITIKPAGGKIQIQVDNEKLNVPYDYFHSFMRETSGDFRCMVCIMIQALKPEEEDSHTSSDQHMERIMLPVNDSDCYRRITHWSHCILCNEILMTYFECKHNQLLKHCTRKRESTVFQGQNSNTTVHKDAIKGQPSYVMVDPSKSVNVQPVLQHPDQSNNVDIEPQRQKITLEKQDSQNQTVQINVGNIIHYPFAATDSPGDVFCVICACPVPNKLSNREGHVNGKRHATNMENVKLSM